MTTSFIAVAAEEVSTVQLLLPDWAELIWGSVAFAILIFVMAKFVFPKLNQTLEERASAIQGKMEEADNKLIAAEQSKANYEAEIADVKGEASRLIEDARVTAESLRAEIIQKAEAEAAAVVERAQGDIQAERDRVMQELRSQVGVLSVQLASRIVERELDQTTHEGLVDEYIQRLSSQN